MTTMTPARSSVTGGVDTHRDEHVAAVLDPVGGLLGTASFPTTATGYRSGCGRRPSAIAMVRLSSDPTTHAYSQRRQAEGKTKTEALRCLKRYIAREVYNALPKSALASQ